MRILILGGQGFIGYNLCNELLKEKNNIIVLEKKIDKERKIKKITYFQCDFTKINSYKHLLNNVDIIYHLISTTNVNNSNDKIVQDIQDNLIGTIRLLNECVKHKKIKKIIFISSGGTVYGEKNSFPIKESSQENPISSYGIVKLAIEKYLALYNHEYGLNYAILRISNAYGPNHKSKDQGLINVLLNKIVNNESFELYGDGNIKRDYIYIDDIINALIIIKNINTKEKIFNIGSGKSYSINEIIKITEEITNKKIKIIYKPQRKQDVFINELDISLAKQKLKWEPKTNLYDGIKKTFISR